MARERQRTYFAVIGAPEVRNAHSTGARPARDLFVNLRYERISCMDGTIAVTSDVRWLGVNDHDTELFEAIWPLPQGVCYNSYLMIDEKITLIDTVKGNYFGQFLEKLRRDLPEGRSVDYLVVNHMEPDHSGSLGVLLELYPGMRIIGNKKTADLLNNFYGITDNIRVVADGDTLDTGRHKLRFFTTPMVHWPESMVTYDHTDRVLFSSDIFGGFGVLSGGIFDDEVNLGHFEDEILRYFSNIVGKYSTMAQKAIRRLDGIEIAVIAPAHGPVFRKNPRYIVDLYDRWSRYEGEDGAVVAYASMYRNTEKMAEAVARSLAVEGICCVRLHNVSKTHLSYLIRDTAKLFPLMDLFVRHLDHRMMQHRILGIFGSYSWSGGALKDLKGFAGEGKWNVVQPTIEAKSAPTDDNLDACRELGSNIAGELRKKEG